MSEYIAVDGCTIKHSTGSPISGGTFTITSIPSIVSKCQNKGIYKTPLVFTFTGGNASGFISGTVAGAGTIISKALKVKAENLLVIREKDSGILSATGTLVGGGSGSISGNVEIDDPGQDKSKAE